MRSLYKFQRLALGGYIVKVTHAPNEIGWTRIGWVTHEDVGTRYAGWDAYTYEWDPTAGEMVQRQIGIRQPTRLAAAEELDSHFKKGKVS